jgi:hypothetical protein
MLEQLELLSPIELILFLSDYITVFIGLIISYIAYRGYRDHQSKPMLYVAVGFVLLLGVPGLLGVLVLTLPVKQIIVGALTQASEIFGMLSILYGLWVDPK